MKISDQVIAYQQANSHRWRDKDDNYWLQRLMQEVGELASSLADDHEDPPERELMQIASIAINWLVLRKERQDAHSESVQP